MYELCFHCHLLVFFDSGWIMDNGQCDLMILSISLIKQFYHIIFPFRSILHQVVAFCGFWNLKKTKICVSWNVDIESSMSTINSRMSIGMGAGPYHFYLFVWNKTGIVQIVLKILGKVRKSTALEWPKLWWFMTIF